MAAVLRGIAAAAVPLRTLRIAPVSNGVQKKLLNTLSAPTSDKHSRKYNFINHNSDNDVNKSEILGKISTLQFSPFSIRNIDDPLNSFRLPIMESPLIPVNTIIPKITNIPVIESPIVGNNVDCPTNSEKPEKHAIRDLVIRRKKMKKHKLKKLRKRMKYVWAKKKLNRRIKREKGFQRLLLFKITNAEKWSPEKHVENKLKLAYAPRIPHRWKGKRLPIFIIRQLMGLDKRIEYKQFKSY